MPDSCAIASHGASIDTPIVVASGRMPDGPSALLSPELAEVGVKVHAEAAPVKSRVAVRI